MPVARKTSKNQITLPKAIVDRFPGVGAALSAGSADLDSPRLEPRGVSSAGLRGDDAGTDWRWPVGRAIS